MLHFFYIFVIALANNLDNLGTGVAYSLRGTRITTPVNLWISAITFVISNFAASSGTLVSSFLGKRNTSVFSMLLLTIIGSWMIFEHYVRGGNVAADEPARNKRRSGILCVFLKLPAADADASRHVTFREATILGIALSINNVGGGLSAGMIGLTPLWVGLLSAALSFVALWAPGNYLAEDCIQRPVSHKTAAIAGSLLIVLGMKQIL